MTPRFTLALAIALAALTAAPPASAAPRPPNDEEKAACAHEQDVITSRTKLFQGQKLSADEIAKRNQPAQAAFDDCVARYRKLTPADKQLMADQAEVARRVDPDASDAVKAETLGKIRRERLAAKPASQLTPEEREELLSASPEDQAAARAAADAANAANPAFMRTVQSAVSCYHTARKAELQGRLAQEQSLEKIGKGDRQAMYSLKSELRQTDDVLARSREEAKQFKDGLARCNDPQVAILSHCLGSQFEEAKADPACDAEEIQQYLRFVK
jgi:hypothetical protein